jgi:hypothetical protein
MYREQKSTCYKEENKNKTTNKAKKVKPSSKGKNNVKQWIAAYLNLNLRPGTNRRGNF